MKLKNSRGGFTLVELLVVILTGSVITLAAVTILLLGLRVNNQSGETVTRQNTTRVLLTAMEDVIAEGTVTGITAGPDSWVLSGKREGEEAKPLFSYSSTDRTICTGGRVILEDVIASHITWDDTGKLITISVETEGGSYAVSTYCRMGIPVAGDEKVDDLIDQYQPPQNPEVNTTADARTKFLQILASQYKMIGGGVNPGLILDENKRSTGEYYSQWYESTWPADTAWCVCYVSWALDKTGEMSAPSDAGWPRWFANTEYFKDYILKKEKTTPQKGWYDRVDANPQPGDLIFFDWNGNGETQHIGVVLTVSGDYIYTIEGNSANRVAVRKYALSDKCIDGYVSFTWLLENHQPENANQE